MARLDYSRFAGLGESDSEEEKVERNEADHQSLLVELPSDLPRGLSLVLAARQGQQHLVEALLQSRVEVDSRDPHGGSALLRAVQLGIAARPTVEALLAAKADVSLASDFGETPLSEAASSGPAELLEALLAASQHKAPSEQTLGAALVKASEARNRGTTRVLLQHKAPAMPEALFGWLKSDAVDMLEALLERRAKVNQPRDHDGDTPLVAAAAAGRPAVLQLLCRWKAEPDLANRKGTTALVAAARSAVSAADAVEALLQCRASLEASEDMSPLVAAALSGSAPVAQRLLAARAVPGAADARGRTPLAAAAAAKTLQLCQLLLAARADANQLGTSGAGGAGAAPLAIAVAAGQMALTLELLDAGADVDGSLSERGQTPLMLAAAAANLELCEKLLQARANPNSDDEKSPLVLAAGIGAEEVCKVLLGANAMVNSGKVPALHAAAANGHEAVCRLLLSSRADLQLCSAQERTAAETARRAGYAQVAQLLTAE